MGEAVAGHARRLYRVLMALLPGRFRHRFGADMEDLFVRRLSTAGSVWERTWVWIRGVVDVLGYAALERLRPAPKQEGQEDGMGTRMQDLRWAARTLGRSPLFTAMAVITLALGIGASTATFSVVSTVLIKDLPYHEPRRLVAVWPEANFNNGMVRESLKSMPALASETGISGWSLTLVGEGEPLELDANRVWPNHFRVLGAAPALGRDFTAEEGLPGRNDVVILSHALWVRVFGADPDVVGRTIQLSGADADTHTVIGVMPRDFRPVVGHPDAWIPMGYDPAVGMEADDSWYVNYRVARLAPGATVARAQEQVEAFARTVRERLPRSFDEEDVSAATVQPLAAYVSGDLGPVLWVTLGAVSLVLLIACANVANLLLARGEARGADLAVRTALGAGRRRMIRMLLSESAMLAGLGGALGVLLSFGLVRLVVAAAPPDFPRIREVAVDGSVLAYAVGATIVAALLAGLVPALRASRVDATASLRGAARAASARRGSTLTLALVGIEVALAVVVAVGSGLMLRSLQRLSAVDTGLDAHGVVVLHPAPPDGRYPDGAAFQTYYAQVLDRVRAVPGVESAGAIHLLPGTLGNWSFPTWPEGVDLPEGSATPSVNFRMIWPGYFETVGMRLVRGRLLEETDGADDEKVAVVNQAFVDRFWPGQDPIGRTVRTLSSTGDAYRVVGVVGNVRQHGLAREPRPEMYFTHRQWGWSMSFWIVARVRGSAPMEHAAALKQAVWDVDRDVPVTGLDELARVFGNSAATTRFLALVLSSFGALALALGAIGVFGVTAFTVGRRAPEFGVRVALGASRTGVLRTALATCALPVGVGVVVGLAGASAASRALRSALFGVAPSDPATFAGVAATLVVVALLASVLPAWRASRVDPVRVLGSE